MTEWRYHAMNIVSRTWLHRDLPLRDVKISPALSGPQQVTATISPEFMSLKTDAGHPILDEWSTFVVCESDNIIRGGGILTSSTFQGDTWGLTFTGFTTYPKGQPMTKTLSYGGNSVDGGRDNTGPTPGSGADPIQIMKDLWAQLQAWPDGNLRVTFTGSSSSKYRMADWKNVPNVYNYTPDATTTVTQDAPENASQLASGGNYSYPVSTVWANVGIRGTGFSKKKVSGTGSVKVPPTGKNIYWNYFEYYYEHPDIGTRIDSLAGETPFDYVENIRWSNSAKDDIILEIVLGYPRIGGRKADLRFAEGENIAEVVTVKRDGDDFANNIQGVGAGEGKDQLRQTVGGRDGRLRRVLVSTDTSITQASRLKNYATEILNTVKNIEDIEGFTLRPHPNAPYGSFRVGDDILVQTWRGWEEIALWCRVTAMSYSPDDEVVSVSCKRSDSFRYGGQSA